MSTSDIRSSFFSGAICPKCGFREYWRTSLLKSEGVGTSYQCSECKTLLGLSLRVRTLRWVLLVIWAASTLFVDSLVGVADAVGIIGIWVPSFAVFVLLVKQIEKHSVPKVLAEYYR